MAGVPRQVWEAGGPLDQELQGYQRGRSHQTGAWVEQSEAIGGRGGRVPQAVQGLREIIGGQMGEASEPLQESAGAAVGQLQRSSGERAVVLVGGMRGSGEASLGHVRGGEGHRYGGIGREVEEPEKHLDWPPSPVHGACAAEQSIETDRREPEGNSRGVFEAGSLGAILLGWGVPILVVLLQPGRRPGDDPELSDSCSGTGCCLLLRRRWDGSPRSCSLPSDAEACRVPGSDRCGDAAPPTLSTPNQSGAP